MEKLRDKIVAELSYGLACHDVQITGTAEKFIADRILAIPGIAEALSLLNAKHPTDAAKDMY